MDFFIFQADVYCGDCGKAIRKRLALSGQAPSNPQDQRSYDSDEYPKGPYVSEQEESDTPQNCAGCGLFLRNPLTLDGVDYVAEMIRDNPGDCTEEWAAFYAEELSRI